MAIITGTQRQSYEHDARGYQWFQSGVPPVPAPQQSQIAGIFSGSHRSTIQAISGGYQFVRAGGPYNAAPSPGGVVPGRVFVRQEQPAHVAPRRLSGARGPDVSPPSGPPLAGINAVTTQEMPRGHPVGFTQLGVAPSAAPVGAPQINGIIWSSHRDTLSAVAGGYQFFQSGTPPVVVISAPILFGTRANTTQEFPTQHPTPIAHNANLFTAPVFIPAPVRHLSTVQEMPLGHPLPHLFPGLPPVYVPPPPPPPGAGGPGGSQDGPGMGCGGGSASAAGIGSGPRG